MDIKEVMKKLELKFTSGNSIPVEKSTIHHEGWQAIKSWYESNQFSFLNHLLEQEKFSEETFGPGIRTQGIIDHIQKELKEIVKTKIQSKDFDLNKIAQIHKEKIKNEIKDDLKLAQENSAESEV